MKMNRYIYLLLSFILVITGCPQPNAKAGAQPNAKAVEGVYEGTAAMRMDESRPLQDYPGTFTATMTGKDTVHLKAHIKPGKMPFPVNYTLKKPCTLRYTATGYPVSGSFKVDVTLKSGTIKDMPNFHFTLGERSRIYIDTDGAYWLELYYPDTEMLNGRVLSGPLFFKGKKKA